MVTPSLDCKSEVPASRGRTVIAELDVEGSIPLLDKGSGGGIIPSALGVYRDRFSSNRPGAVRLLWHTALRIQY